MPRFHCPKHPAGLWTVVIQAMETGLQFDDCCFFLHRSGVYSKWYDPTMAQGEGTRGQHAGEREQNLYQMDCFVDRVANSIFVLRMLCVLLDTEWALKLSFSWPPPTVPRLWWRFLFPLLCHAFLHPCLSMETGMFDPIMLMISLVMNHTLLCSIISCLNPQAHFHDSLQWPCQYFKLHGSDMLGNQSDSKL